MKTLITIILLCVIPFAGQGQQTLTIEDCYTAARANYPLSRQRDLLSKTASLTVENAAKGALPRIQLGAQATYQSDVTQIPVEMPGIEPLSKDQYRVFAEVSQMLYQGGLVAHEKEVEASRTSVEEAQLEVELYALEKRINDLFFGILLLQEQQKQSGLMKADLNAALKKTNAAVANGTALPSAAAVLQAELLTLEQGIIEMQASESLYRKTLGSFIGRPVGPDTSLEKPEFTAPPLRIQRPEENVFILQKRQVEANQALLSARKKPRLELFLQGGYGRPGLNMLENTFDFYYVGGIRLAWQLSGYYTFAKEKEILELRRQTIDVRRETFVFNTDRELDRSTAEIEKLRRLIEIDAQSIALRTSVRETAEAQLEEGVISASDYVREVNAEARARQSRVLHETQLLSAQAAYHFTSGQ